MSEQGRGAAAELLRRLRGRGWTIAVAESLTGGLVTAALIDVPGSSAVVRGGVVAYDTALKNRLLGVDADLLAAHGPVHADVAAQMAHGVRRALAIDDAVPEMGISTTGIAGPSSPDGQPVGTVHLGVSTPAGTRTRRHAFDGDRSAIRMRSVVAALELALDVL